MAIDIDHLRAWIGRTEELSEALTPAHCARFNATFDRSTPITEGQEAPPLIHFCLNQQPIPTRELDTDGHPKRVGFLPPVPLPRRMWAGGEIEFLAPMTIGSIVTRRSEIEDVSIKQGRSGTLCFVTVRHNVFCGSKLVLKERQDIVYRNAASGPTNAPQTIDAAPTGEQSKTVAADAPFLFRYSALTFNGHRIHYDLPYAQKDEHYPGLVVHGPLQATLLCLFAVEIIGATPTKFNFRSTAPIFGPGAFSINVNSAGSGLRLWTATSGGPAGMEARAEW